MAKVFEVDVSVGDRIAVGGISVFPLTSKDMKIGPPYLTAPEAYEAGLIEVSEMDPPEVPRLAVTNLAEVPILLVEGEMLTGGNQNRTLNVTVLCPPGVQIHVPVSCVEAGRWGSRRTMSSPGRHAPGSLRAAKTANLEARTFDTSSRRSSQRRVWEEVERQSIAHEVPSETFALEDVQREIEGRIAAELDQIEPVPDQIGVVCTIGDRVIGMDLFDNPATLERYLRGIVAGHVLDAPPEGLNSDAIRSIERFLRLVGSASRDTGRGVGLGQEIVLSGEVTGIGLTYEGSLIHVAAFAAAQ
jgi:ARG/rhodanese/phosphatase superfamily protein